MGAFDAARAQPYDAIAALGQRVVVRHQDERGAAFNVSGEQQVDHLPAGGFVEIAGRLVGNQNCRIGRQRPGQSYALLFAGHVERGTTLILVTHDTALAQRCDRIVRLRSGRIEGAGTS